MTLDAAMAVMLRLGVAAEALGAVGARLRADGEGIALHPSVAAGLDDVVAALGLRIEDLTAQERVIAAGAARAFVLLAADLVAEPGRAPGWSVEDPGVMLSLGRLSGVIAGVIAQVAPSLDGLADALDREGAAICDVGSGVGALAIAMCRTWPRARVVGLDPWAPAHALAREELAASGVADRIELRESGVEQLVDEAAFDAVWFAGPFIPPALVIAGLKRVHEALRPGGWLLFGLFAGPPDPLALAVQKLRVVRSGGTVKGADSLTGDLAAAGFIDVHPIDRTWQAPVALLAGRRPPA